MAASTTTGAIRSPSPAPATLPSCSSPGVGGRCGGWSAGSGLVATVCTQSARCRPREFFPRGAEPEVERLCLVRGAGCGDRWYREDSFRRPSWRHGTGRVPVCRRARRDQFSCPEVVFVIGRRSPPTRAPCVGPEANPSVSRRSSSPSPGPPCSSRRRVVEHTTRTAVSSRPGRVGSSKCSPPPSALAHQIRTGEFCTAPERVFRADRARPRVRRRGSVAVVSAA